MSPDRLDLGGVRVVIGLRESPAQIFITNRLLERLPVVSVVLERPRRSPLRRVRRIAKRKGILRAASRSLDLAYFKCRAALTSPVERRLLFGDGSPAELPADAPLHVVSSINSKKSQELIAEANPDILIINGTSIVKGEVIGLARTAAINIHTGIVPDFRGCTPEFWALYHGRRDGIGVTIHHLETAIDGGDVILMRRTPVSADDDDVTLRCRNARLGADMLVEAAQMLAAGTAPRHPQDPEAGSYFSQRNLWQDLSLRLRMRGGRGRQEPEGRGRDV